MSERQWGGKWRTDMAGEWITWCGDCPMWSPLPEQVTGACCAHAPSFQGEEPAITGRDAVGCSEPLRMAIAAGYLSVEAFTKAIALKHIEHPLVSAVYETRGRCSD